MGEVVCDSASIKAPTRRDGRFLAGLSLIESVIVLGVIGLVLGSVWAGAAHVRQNMVISKTVSGILVMERNLNRIFDGKTATNVLLSSTQIRNMDVIQGADGFTLAGRAPFRNKFVLSYWTPGKARVHILSSSAQVIPVMGSSPCCPIIPTGLINANIANIAIPPATPTYLSMSDCISFIAGVSAAAKHLLESITLGAAVFTSFPVMPTSAECTNQSGITFAFK